MKWRDSKGKEGGDQVLHRALAILSSSVNLPPNFLCDTGYLFETVFSKPPNEALPACSAISLIRGKALERDIVELDGVDQVNLALKQLKGGIFLLDDVQKQKDGRPQKDEAEEEDEDEDGDEGDLPSSTRTRTD